MVRFFKDGTERDARIIRCPVETSLAVPKIKREKNIAANAVDWGPDIDFTMKEGETIQIQMPGAKLKKDSEKSLLVDEDSSTSGILAPPPSKGGGRRRRRRKGKQTSGSTSGGTSGGDDGLGGLFDSIPTTSTEMTQDNGDGDNLLDF